MGLAGGNRPHPRAIIFDLDRCLIDSRGAWRYCIEESIAAAAGRRVDASSLVEEYHIRPWRDALGVLAAEREEVARCENLCAAMFERSAMKKLLVHEGIGMALDALRGERIELGAISRLPHALAVKQVQSTGLDRFLAVLSATPADAAWRPVERIQHCLRFLEASPAQSALTSGEELDLVAAGEYGLAVLPAAWAPGYNHEGEAMASPSDMVGTVLRLWARRPA